MAKIPDIAEPGTLVVGASDSSKQQYTDNGRALGQAVIVDGGRLASVYDKHASAHGVKTIMTSITPITKRTGKAKLKPTPKVEVIAPIQQPVEVAAPIATKEERNKYTAIFKIPTGTIRVDILDILFSESQRAVIFIYKDMDAITYTPEPGDVFDVACVDKLTKANTNLRVFSPDFIFNIPNSEKVMMVLVLDTEGDTE